MFQGPRLVISWLEVFWPLGDTKLKKFEFSYSKLEIELVSFYVI